MDYFWLIPAGFVGAFLLWMFYASITREKGAGERTDGRVLVDRPSEKREETIVSDAEYLHLKRTDDPD